MRKPKALNASQLAALEVLIEYSDGWRRQGRSEGQPETYAALYWHTLKPSYCWPGCGWNFSPATLRSLVGRGLAEFKPGFERAHWTRVTEAGRLALADVTATAAGPCHGPNSGLNPMRTIPAKSGAT